MMGNPPLREIPSLKKLDRISPSQYGWINQCALRGVLSKSEAPLLPSTPKRRVGIIIHKILEQVGRGRLDPRSERVFKEAWEEQVEGQEQRMDSSWLESRFVPLSKSVPKLQVLYYQTRSRAKEVHEKKRNSTGAGRGREEEWVESTQGLVAGRIDRVIEFDGGAILQDYKSGAISLPGTEAVKESYQNQLKLYAALYYETHGKWPKSLKLVGLDGTVKTIDYKVEECVILLEKARRLLQRINNKISEVRAGKGNPFELANPAAETCRFCQFRPSCRAYWRVRAGDSSNSETGGWPVDVAGSVVRTKSDSGGRLVLWISTFPEGDEVSIHSVAPYMIEGENTEDLVGNTIGAYNLYQRSEIAYRATQLTAIYH